MKEEKEVETTAQDTDSGNNTAESCSDCEERKSLLTPLEGKEEEEEKEVEEEEGGLVEAQKPRFSSPVWLEDIHSNKLFNKQKSILTEEVKKKFNCFALKKRNNPNLVQASPLPPPPPEVTSQATPHRPERPFPVRKTYKCETFMV